MIRLAWGAAVTLAALAPPAARAADPALCDGAPGTTAIIAPLERFAARIEQGGPLKIVAVGSSSTAGTGATSAAATYPSRLEVELRERLPDRAVDVVNQGHGGEDAPEELARLGRDVVALNPDLAIWQVGTNAVLR
ncbi:MAG TPA: GDSL-type esterase/lipase family protein, partial [Stellaceae bacterium]|nr:GDSL-type esterase/lipase family protein [Stellaceae bacterium]